MESTAPRIIDRESLPAMFPTHRHSPEFWAALGRAVGTFGFLEEMLGKAIYAFSGMRPIPEDEVEEALGKWRGTLERAVSDPLGGLIDGYSKAVREYGAEDDRFSELVNHLRGAAAVRNVICHGSWSPPDAQGRSTPLFITRKLDKFAAPIDVQWLDQLQQHAAELACAVWDSVTVMGWQFEEPASPTK